jgi:hypothetical protein
MDVLSTSDCVARKGTKQRYKVAPKAAPDCKFGESTTRCGRSMKPHWTPSLWLELSLYGYVDDFVADVCLLLRHYPWGQRLCPDLRQTVAEGLLQKGRMRFLPSGVYTLKGTPNVRSAPRGGRVWEPMTLGDLPISLQIRSATSFM